MNIQYFYSIRSFCPVCKNTLSKLAECTLASNSNYEGTISYEFDELNNRFIKQECDLSIKIKILFPNFFSPVEEVFNYFKKQDNTLDICFIRSCHKKDHSYYYTTDMYVELQRDIILYFETLDIGRYRIYNYHDKRSETIIDMDAPRALHTNHLSFPLIPIDKWDLSSIQSLEQQIERYILLK